MFALDHSFYPMAHFKEDDSARPLLKIDQFRNSESNVENLNLGLLSSRLSLGIRYNEQQIL